MSRDLNANNLTAAGAEIVRPVAFVELAYDTQTVRVHSAVGTLSWGGYDWAGVGDFGAVDTIEETAELQVSGLTLTLSGINPDLVNDLLNEDYQGRPVKIYMGWLDADFLLPADPDLIFYGFMDTQTITLGTSATINITVENRLVDWDRPRVLRFNNETQQARFFGDRGFEFVEQAAEKRVVWGQKDPGEA